MYPCKRCPADRGRDEHVFDVCVRTDEVRDHREVVFGLHVDQCPAACPTHAVRHAKLFTYAARNMEV